ncbi:unnamed protein product, partial [Ectocarpus sp. 12 AP-2014]
MVWTTSLSPPRPLGGVTEESEILSTTVESCALSSATSRANFRTAVSRRCSSLLLAVPLPSAVGCGAVADLLIVSTLASAERLIPSRVRSSATSSDSFLMATSARPLPFVSPELTPPSLPPPRGRSLDTAPPLLARAAKGPGALEKISLSPPTLVLDDLSVSTAVYSAGAAAAPAGRGNAPGVPLPRTDAAAADDPVAVAEGGVIVSGADFPRLGW